jgi:ComF family protein
MRRWQRGYNQSEFLASALAAEMQIPLWKYLKRVRRVADQKTLSGIERRRNLKGAFALKSGTIVKDYRLLLVDDVMTSGATADSCARILKDAGARQISVAVVAKG